MPTFSVTIVVPFCAGHRLLGHKGKCKNLHGHNYEARVTVGRLDGKKLDEMGFVCDFGELKPIVKEWIDHHWDHTMILRKDDPLIRFSTERKIDPLLILDIMSGLFPDKQPYVMDFNPTAEHMAAELAVSLAAKMPRGVFIRQVEIAETGSTCATWEC